MTELCLFDSKGEICQSFDPEILATLSTDQLARLVDIQTAASAVTDAENEDAAAVAAIKAENRAFDAIKAAFAKAHPAVGFMDAWKAFVEAGRS